MKVSRTWLQKFFEAPLPPAEALADALTFHSSEVEEIEGDTLDVKILPDRACYALSHRGIAGELAAALDLPLKDDPYAAPLPTYPAAGISVTVCDDQLVPRYMAAHMKGVKVESSPDWLREALESIGQRSINNVVDATNYVMLHMGQPLHAFDAAKLSQENGGYAITVRKAREGEKLTTLTGEEYVLPEGTLLIADAVTDTGLGIAGIKGGKHAEVHEGTTDLIIEAANFDGTQVRRAAQALKLFTEASTRFQNRPSAELVPYGVRDVLALIQEIAGGEVIGVTDRYPVPQETPSLTVSLDRINGVMGTSYSTDDVAKAFTRLGFSYEQKGDEFTVIPPFVRRDLTIPEDLAEEAGRILGYENIPGTPLPPNPDATNQDRYRGIERIKDVLLERGYVEISTPSFTEAGDIELANPLQMDRPFLRPDLAGNMRNALLRAKREAPRTLGPEPWLKLFELGNIFTKDGEHLALAFGYETLAGKASKTALDEDIDALTEGIPGLTLTKPAHDGTVVEIPLAGVDLEAAGKGYVPKELILGPFQPYSIYPFALRDIAVWTPDGTEESEVALLIQKEAGDLLLRMDLFDQFDKDGKTSYAFRLVFEAPDRTLSDADLDPLMERVTTTLNAHEGWKVR